LRKIFLYSGKGGVGKSSVSILLAKALLNKGFKTGILDCDFNPSIPMLLNLNPESSLNVEGDQVKPLVLNGLEVWSLGFMLPNQSIAITWRGQMRREVVKGLNQINWGELDYLIIDGPPGFSDEVIEVMKSIDLTGAIIVTTPHPLAYASAKRAVAVAKNNNVPLIGAVINMNTDAHIGQDLGTQILCTIPYSEDIYNRRFDPKYVEQAIPKIVEFKPPSKKPSLKRWLARRAARL
jgi:ATP-binding protein involved in chromosome partitioning